MAIAGGFGSTARSAGINLAAGFQAQRRQEQILARIRAGVQPNRTPSAGLLARLGEPIPGSPGAGGGGGSFTPLPPPPGTGGSPVAADAGTPIATQGSSIGTNAPPAVSRAPAPRVRRNSAAGDLRSFLQEQNA